MNFEQCMFSLGLFFRLKLSWSYAIDMVSKPVSKTDQNMCFPFMLKSRAMAAVKRDFASK